MTEPRDATTPEQDRRFHSYQTHRIPWYVRAIWLAYWIGAVWYVFEFAIPWAKRFFE